MKSVNNPVVSATISINPFKSVGIKLFLIIFGSILACVITIGMLAYSKTKDIVETKVSDASFQTINQVADNLDIVFKTYEDISMQFLVDKDFHDTSSALLNAEDEYSKFEATKKITDMLQYISLSNDSIKGILLLPLQEKLKPIAVGNADTSRAAELMETDWFKKIMDLNGGTYWVEPQSTGLATASQLPSIALGRQLNNSVTSRANYVLLMEIPVESISEHYSDVVLGDGSELSILDMEGNYIASNDSALIGTQAPITLPVDPEVNGADTLAKRDGNEVLAAYRSFHAMDWRLVGTIPVQELVKAAHVIRDVTLVTALLAALIAIAIGYLVILTIARPIVKLSELMEEGASGNLTVRSTLKKRRDEIFRLSESFNRMMVQISELANQTTQSAEQVLATAGELTESSRRTALSAREISVATEEIAKGATSLAMESERGSDLSFHIQSQMKEVMTANEEMVRSAGEVELASKSGTDHMGALMQKTERTENMTRAMVEKVDALKDSTTSIVKILDVLNNLTKQTNILSLNATIEAARAGAAGKGFMVVADEIRQLADQSKQSIDIVAGITERISGEIEETVNVLSEAYPLFREQVESVKEANGIFLSVQGQMGGFQQRLDDVTSSVAELEKSQNVLAEAMTNVSAVAEESSATSEEVASLSSEQLNVSEGLVKLSEQLDAVSRGLKETLTKFKL